MKYYINSASNGLSLRRWRHCTIFYKLTVESLQTNPATLRFWDRPYGDGTARWVRRYDAVGALIKRPVCRRQTICRRQIQAASVRERRTAESRPYRAVPAGGMLCRNAPHPPPAGAPSPEGEGFACCLVRGGTAARVWPPYGEGRTAGRGTRPLRRGTDGGTGRRGLRCEKRRKHGGQGLAALRRGTDGGTGDPSPTARDGRRDGETRAAL